MSGFTIGYVTPSGAVRIQTRLTPAGVSNLIGQLRSKSCSGIRVDGSLRSQVTT